eukprot:SAG31_NODE_429_length_15801_cov_6.878551_11_plen_209_part_00
MMRKMQQENPEMFANMGGMRGMMGGYPGAGMMGGGMGGRGKKPKKEKPPPAWRKGLSDGQLIDFEEAAKKFSTGRLMKNTLKDTRAMLDNGAAPTSCLRHVRSPICWSVAFHPSLTPHSRFAAAEYYVKTMERIQERGSKYPRTERERIKGILKKGGLKKDKQAQMEARVNILVCTDAHLMHQICRALWLACDPGHVPAGRRLLFEQS